MKHCLYQSEIQFQDSSGYLVAVNPCHPKSCWNELWKEKEQNLEHDSKICEFVIIPLYRPSTRLKDRIVDELF